MTNNALMRLLGIGSVGLVLILGALLFISFTNNRDKEAQLAEEKKKNEKLAADLKDAATTLKEKTDALEGTEKVGQKTAKDAEAKLKDAEAKLTEELGKVRAQLKTLDANLTEARTAAAKAKEAADAEKSAADKKLQKAEGDLAAATKAKMKLEAEVVDLAAAKKAMQKQADEAKALIDKVALIQKERDDFAAKVKQAEAEIQQVKKAADNLAAVKDQALQLIAKEVQNLKDQMAALTKKYADVDGKIVILQKAEAAARQNAEAASAEAVKAKAELVKAQADLAAARKEIDRLKELLKDKEAALKPADPAAVQGAWKKSKYSKGGNGAGFGNYILIKGDEAWLGDIDEATRNPVSADKFKVTINPKVNPPAIDFVNADVELRGIYQFEGHDLVITFLRGGGRPKDFAPKEGDWSSYVLKRVK